MTTETEHLEKAECYTAHRVICPHCNFTMGVDEEPTGDDFYIQACDQCHKIFKYRNPEYD